MRWRCLAPALLLGPLVSGGAEAIVVRHDHDAVATKEQAGRFRAVCKILPDGEGVLIAPQWVLTADHVASDVGVENLRVRFDGADYRVEEVIPHPEAGPGKNDLALLRLRRPIQRIEPLELELGDGLEVGTVVQLAGRGDHGDGIEAVVGNDGQLRIADNAIHKLEGVWILIRLDSPDDGALPAEGISGPGDSGTPALVERDGKLRVVGIGSVGQNPQGKKYGEYGSIDIFIRLKGYEDWLRSVLDR